MWREKGLINFMEILYQMSIHKNEKLYTGAYRERSS